MSVVEMDDVEDHSSDNNHDTSSGFLPTNSDRRIVNEVVANGNQTALSEPVKITTEQANKLDPDPVLGPSRGGSMSTTAELDNRRSSDAASVRSLPAVQITEPHSPARHSPAVDHSQAHHHSESSPLHSRASDSPAGSTLSASERRQRHRSAVEFRSPNRFSGFLTNLIHRREPNPSSSSRNLMSNDTALNSGLNPSETPPRADSPYSRPVTPPPSLPAPTLQELGLALSVVTSDLSPAHFSTAPSSGTFLAPHYLLLCHAQGLDVLPIVSPPASQPYALVRRVSFKSVVVMEQRGVLVAIAGRRDGVRVYALDEVKKAVEWRMEVEIRREQERQRRDAGKKITLPPTDLEHQPSLEKKPLPRPLTPPTPRAKPTRRLSFGPSPPSRASSTRRPSTPVSTPPHASAPLPLPTPLPTASSEPSGRPPPYSASASPEALVPLRSQPSTISIARSAVRPESVVDVLAGRRNMECERERAADEKADWAEGSSDDEAINVVAAGASGSQALDERTSAQHSATMDQTSEPLVPLPQRMSSSPNNRRAQPGDLDFSQAAANGAGQFESASTPTLLTFRHTLAQQPSPIQTRRRAPHVPNLEEDDNDEPSNSRGDRITLAQALMESRLPDLPPAGTRRCQQPVLIASSHPVATGDDDLVDGNGVNSHVSLAQMLMESRLPDLPPAGTRRPQEPIMLSSAQRETGRRDASSNSETERGSRRARGRRRWTGLFSTGSSNNSAATPAAAPPTEGTPAAMGSVGSLSSLAEMSGARSHGRSGTSLFSRSSVRSGISGTLSGSQSNLASSAGARSTTSTHAVQEPPDLAPAALPPVSSLSLLTTPTHSRFLPRIISNALHTRRSDEHAQAVVNALEHEQMQRFSAPLAPHAPPPKLEYVKLPGTKNALSIKAVETAKKSFLAILCGDNGEKVELFAGTYRTALGLSRTFILPDSPRSLELQLQGDDLVEVFLMFSQNVFGLEPATVRVREVRIGRAERRAARRRARELRSEETTAADQDLNGADDDNNVNASIGLSVTSESAPGGDATALIPTISPEGPTTHAQASTAASTSSSAALAHADDLLAIVTAQMGPYTTFQQLSFPPNFPLASIADEYIIPPTYPEFCQHRDQHESGNGSSASSSANQSQMQFTPPGLPVPTPAPPSKWYYRDPKDVVHGPWKASLMQAWYKDGLLPPDLPVRREEEPEYVLLKDLRLQSIDPTHPFRSPPPPPADPQPRDGVKPLLAPVSLLAQPKHFGPPALFFSSRGGHSTTIVDARGRSVLKGRFLWSGEDEEPKVSSQCRMGDVKRLEAFDVKDRSILVAMRQGGLEVVDLVDALLRPADESRTTLPQYIAPASNVGRRSPFVWRIGTPVAASPTSSTVLSSSRPKPTHLNLHYKRQSTSGARLPGRTTEFGTNDLDSGCHEEVLYLGRKDDEIYICERNAGAFRILRLSPCP